MRKRAPVEAVGTALMAALGFLGGCGGDIRDPRVTGTAVGRPRTGATPGRIGEFTTATSRRTPPVCTNHPLHEPFAGPAVGGSDTRLRHMQWRHSAAARHRGRCPSLIPRASGQCARHHRRGQFGVCFGQCDCTSQPNGYCTNCLCFYGCRRDSDCGYGQICTCGDPVGTCNLASCSSGASCHHTGCDCVNPTPSGFACQTQSDQCLSSADCALSQVGCGDECLESEGHTVCQANNCGNGRPFLVHGSERLRRMRRPRRLVLREDRA